MPAGIVTEEMEYVAIREQACAQTGSGMVSREAITPEMVRREIAQGRAILPANINHPEVEPMIIGRNFAVKINANIGNSALRGSIAEEVEKMVWAVRWGADTVMDLSTGADIHDTREWIIRNSPVPIGSVPLYQALEKTGGQAADLTWDLMRDTLIEQAEQGVDYFTLHAAPSGPFSLAASRLTGIVSRAGLSWRCGAPPIAENFLYTHWDEICEILAAYDVGFPSATGCVRVPCTMPTMRPVRRIEKQENSPSGLGAVRTGNERGAGPCAPESYRGKIWTNRLIGVVMPLLHAGTAADRHRRRIRSHHFRAGCGADRLEWRRHALHVTPKEHLGLPDKEDVREGVVVHKLAAHAADLAKGLPGAQLRDNALSKARYEFRWSDQIALSLDPERALRLRAEAVPGAKQAPEGFCSMCGPNFCSMRLYQKLCPVHKRDEG